MPWIHRIDTNLTTSNSRELLVWIGEEGEEVVLPSHAMTELTAILAKQEPARVVDIPPSSPESSMPRDNFRPAGVGDGPGLFPPPDMEVPDVYLPPAMDDIEESKATGLFKPTSDEEEEGL